MEINGKKVIDAKRPLNIEVLSEDCRKGKTKDAARCAAARAILREYENVLGARVHRSVTYIEYPESWVRYLTPVSLRTELTVFDRGAAFEPGPHTLGAPSHTSQSLTELRKSRADNRTGSHAGKNKRTRHEIPNIRPRGANR